jgi:DNA-binding response OmpR family regulator
MNILIVEDESYVAEMLRRALEELGNECLLAFDATTAQEMLDEHEVEALTLDLGMPGPSGLDWLENLATTRPELAARTLVITGQTLDPDAAQRLARCGAGLLAKPFTLDHLEEAVRAQIDRPAHQLPN